VHVIFLDIDGVLNSEAFGKKLEAQHHKLEHTELDADGAPVCTCFALENQIDDAAVARLNRLVDVTSAKIVISSTWRKRFDLIELGRILATHGLIGEILGVTPNAFDEATRFDMKMEYGSGGDRLYRGHEIDYWLRYQGEGVTHFVILDDDSDMVMHAKRLVQTDPDIGLCDENVELAIRVLAWDGTSIPSPTDVLED